MRLTFLDAVKDLLVDALGARLSPGVHDYLDLFVDDGVMETPYAPSGSDGPTTGRAAIAARMEALHGVIRLADFALTAAYPVSNGQSVVLEYVGTVHLERKGTSFRQSYISVLTLRDGRLALWREYTNPLAAQAALPAAVNV